jgi:hypothetical protein
MLKQQWKQKQKWYDIISKQSNIVYKTHRIYIYMFVCIYI